MEIRKQVNAQAEATHGNKYTVNDFILTAIGGDQASEYSLAGFEFNVVGDPSPVPVPAALPLLAGGLGLLAFFGWRRKRTAAT